MGTLSAHGEFRCGALCPLRGQEFFSPLRTPLRGRGFFVVSSSKESVPMRFTFPCPPPPGLIRLQGGRRQRWAGG